MLRFSLESFFLGVNCILLSVRVVVVLLFAFDRSPEQKRSERNGGNCVAAMVAAYFYRAWMPTNIYDYVLSVNLKRVARERVPETKKNKNQNRNKSE